MDVEINNSVSVFLPMTHFPNQCSLFFLPFQTSTLSTVGINIREMWTRDMYTPRTRRCRWRCMLIRFLQRRCCRFQQTGKRNAPVITWNGMPMVFLRYCWNWAYLFRGEDNEDKNQANLLTVKLTSDSNRRSYQSRKAKQKHRERTSIGCNLILCSRKHFMCNHSKSGSAQCQDTISTFLTFIWH